MTEGDELRRRAQTLLDGPPYERPPTGDIANRASSRRQRARGAAMAAVAVAAVLGIVVIRAGDDGRRRGDTTLTPAATTTTTTTVAPPPPGTTIADLRLTEIAPPARGVFVSLQALDGSFLAVEQTNDSSLGRVWRLDSRRRWRAVTLAPELRGTRGVSFSTARGQVIAIARRDFRSEVLNGASLDSLRPSQWNSSLAALPAAMPVAPPPGKGIAVGAQVESVAVGDSGLVVVGRVSADFNRTLLPQAVQAALRRGPGNVVVVGGNVIVNGIGANGFTKLYERPAAELGLTAAEVEYLAQPEERYAVSIWRAAWGEPVEQVPPADVPIAGRAGNLAALAVRDGFLVAVPRAGTTDLWFSTDGRKWEPRAPLSRPIAWDPGGAIVDLGSRLVVGELQVVSGDGGRTWTPMSVPPSVPGGALGLTRGSTGFGVLGVDQPINVSNLVTGAATIGYSPDGLRWTSAPLDELLGFKANTPSIAANDESALISASLRAPGARAQRFWVVSIASRARSTSAPVASAPLRG